LDQRLTNIEVVFRLEELQQRPLQLAIAQCLRHVELLLRKRIEARVAHARRNVERFPTLHIVAQERRPVCHCGSGPYPFSCRNLSNTIFVWDRFRRYLLDLQCRLLDTQTFSSGPSRRKLESFIPLIVPRGTPALLVKLHTWK